MFFRSLRGAEHCCNPELCSLARVEYHSDRLERRFADSTADTLQAPSPLSRMLPFSSSKHLIILHRQFGPLENSSVQYWCFYMTCIVHLSLHNTVSTQLRQLFDMSSFVSCMKAFVKIFYSLTFSLFSVDIEVSTFWFLWTLQPRLTALFASISFSLGFWFFRQLSFFCQSLAEGKRYPSAKLSASLPSCGASRREYEARVMPLKHARRWLWDNCSPHE